MVQTLIAELKALPRPVWALLACLVILGAFLYGHRDWRVHQRLAADGMHVQGVVTGKDLIGGKSVDYSFRVGDKLYRGTGTGGYGNPEFSSLNPDDEVVVFFLPQDPTVSAMGDPKLRVEDQHRWMAWGLVIAVPLLGLTIASELKRHG